MHFVALSALPSTLCVLCFSLLEQSFMSYYSVMSFWGLSAPVLFQFLDCQSVIHLITLLSSILLYFSDMHCPFHFFFCSSTSIKCLVSFFLVHFSMQDFVIHFDFENFSFQFSLSHFKPRARFLIKDYSGQTLVIRAKSCADFLI